MPACAGMTANIKPQGYLGNRALFSHQDFFHKGDVLFHHVVLVSSVHPHVDDITDIEWAIWTRVGNPSRFVLIPDVLGWELDRVADDELKSLRVGIDATMALADVEKLVRPAIPGASKIHIEDYIEPGAELSLAGSRKHG